MYWFAVFFWEAVDASGLTFNDYLAFTWKRGGPSALFLPRGVELALHRFSFITHILNGLTADRRFDCGTANKIVLLRRPIGCSLYE